MEFIRIDGFDKPLASIIMGTMLLSEDDPDNYFALLDAYVAAGGTTFDTAHIYGRGKSERGLGQWLKRRGDREKFTIITKGAHYDPKDFSSRVTPEHIASDLRESLERLQLDHVDLYFLHRDDPEVPVEPIVDALNGHLEEGRIRAFGASNWATERIVRANEYAARNGLRGFVCTSVQFSLAKQNEPMWKGALSAGDDDVEWLRRNRFPLLAWSSLAGGFFSGRYAPDRTDNKDMVRVYYSGSNWEKYRRVEELARRKGFAPAEIALAYVIRQPFPSFALIGPLKVEELESGLRALDVRLTQEEIEWLELKTPILRQGDGSSP